MAKALNVARYLIHQAAAEDEPDFLTHLRLQKLLYYVQGWSLAERGKPMFPERIEAWAHGPVVRELYPVFADWVKRPIMPEMVSPPADTDLETEEKDFIDAVWAAYQGFSASRLREMTHQESPWLDARQGCAPADRCDNEITKESMRAFFSKQSQ